jgi:ribonuclease inhibitor
MKNIAIDGREMPTRTAVHAYLAEKLSLPDYYGRNLDALYDCLNDISEPTHIFITYCKELENSLGSYAGTLLQVFSNAATDNRFLNVSFDKNTEPPSGS